MDSEIQLQRFSQQDIQYKPITSDKKKPEVSSKKDIMIVENNINDKQSSLNNTKSSKIAS